MGIPASSDIIGQCRVRESRNLRPPCHRCKKHGHASWECPIRHFEVRREPCPGFDAGGNRVASAWVGDKITADTMGAWRSYILRHKLPPSRDLPDVPSF